MSKRIVIIGAGVIGLSTAYYCARRGFQVTVIERNPAQRDGCSFGNAGMVVPSHFIPLAAPGMVALGLKWMWNPASPFYIKPRCDAALFDWAHKFWRAATPEHVRRSAPLIRDLSFASRDCFEELAGAPSTASANFEINSAPSRDSARRSGIGDFDLVKKGLLMLCRTEHALHEEGKTAEQARALGVPAQILDARQTAALDPGATMKIAGSVYFPKDCHLSPAKFMALLQTESEKLGVKFIWDRDVADWKIETGRTLRAVRLANGQFIEGDEFVLCGGSWSPQLAEKLALNIPIQAGKGYSLTLPKPRLSLQICSILCEARVAVTPMGETLRVGGTMEIAGLNEDISPVRVRGIIDSFCRYYPEFKPSDFDGVQPWRGLRPCSADGLPYLGRTAKFNNLSLATGHAMMGLSLGPITGKLMAEVLAAEKPSHDLTILSPDRYN